MTTFDPPSPRTLPAPAPPGPHRNRRPRRPAWLLIVALAGVAQLGRRVLGNVWGGWGALAGLGLLIAIAVGWHLFVRARARKHGVLEYTPAMLRQQIESSGVAPPAFPEDGTLLGASVIAVNQRSKLIEVQTEYEVFASDGTKLASVCQVGQGRWKKFFRFVGNFDQFFTHHFEIRSADGTPLLRATRPAKVFRSRLEVTRADGSRVGSVEQRNVFGKIRFAPLGPGGDQLAMLQAENWRAWDFHVELPSGMEVARLTKTWEGFARTYLSNADQYVVRVHQVLGEPLRSLVFAAALTVDVALKQDARGLSAG